MKTIKKFKIFKNGKLVMTDRFYSIEHIKKFLERNNFDSGKYEVQELSVYKDLDVKIITVKGNKI